MFGLTPRRRERRAALARREYTPFEFLRRELTPLFESPTWMFEPMWEVAEPWGFETEEREDEFVLRAEAPGFEPAEIEATLRGNLLTVVAEHKERENAEAKERRYARLERTVALPEGVDLARIEVTYRSGVIEIHLPRTPESKPRRIEVKA